MSDKYGFTVSTYKERGFLHISGVDFAIPRSAAVGMMLLLKEIGETRLPDLAEANRKLVEALEKIIVIAEVIDFSDVTSDPCNVDDKTNDIEEIAQAVLDKYKDKK